MPSESLTDLLDFARQIAFEAGRLTLGYFQTGVKPDFKEDDSPVTIADKNAEELIRTRIEAAYPHHAILGEEFGEVRSGASHRWIIDPIDGTKSFMCGVPIYGTLLGLEIDGECKVGVAYFPGLDEMISAATGHGCSLNGRACRVSEQGDLSRAIMSHADTAAYAENGKAKRWERLQKAVYYNAGWCDAYGYLLVACGRIEIMSDPIMNIWDCAPFLTILREAGGYFGDWSGNETISAPESLGTNQRLREAVLEAMGEE
ncbi:MAG: inositol monophosphatase family protein [Verrucomicrobiota bacterium]